MLYNNNHIYIHNGYQYIFRYFYISTIYSIFSLYSFLFFYH